MKSREAEMVTSNEDYVRMRIFDGDLRIDEAAAELIRIERAQNESLRRQLAEANHMLVLMGRD